MKVPRLARRSPAGCVLLLAAVLASCSTGPMQGSATGVSGSAFAEVVELRSAHGLPAMAPDPALETAARRQAAYMASSGKMEHTTGWRRDFSTRMKADRVAAPAAENLAHGRMGLDRVLEMWMNSTGHRRNMLDPRFTRYGLARSGADGEGRRYWALVLAK